MRIEALRLGAKILLLLVLVFELAAVVNVQGWPDESLFISCFTSIGLDMILLIVLIVFIFLRIKIFLIQIFIIGF